jgi:hypothetical protein
MKPNYRDVLLTVKYCHADYWGSVSQSTREEICKVARIIFNGNIDPTTAYSSRQLLRNVTGEYKDAVVAALLELEMSDI